MVSSNHVKSIIKIEGEMMLKTNGEDIYTAYLARIIGKDIYFYSCSGAPTIM